MNRIKLYVAAIAAAAENSNDKDDAKKAFLATGLTAQNDFALFKQHYDYANGIFAEMDGKKLPSEVAKESISEVMV